MSPAIKFKIEKILISSVYIHIKKKKIKQNHSKQHTVTLLKVITSLQKLQQVLENLSKNIYTNKFHIF